MLTKMKELMDEVYGKNSNVLFEWIESLINSHESSQEDYDVRLRQLHLLEAYVMDQSESVDKTEFLRRINQLKKILFNDIVSGQMGTNDGKRYLLLWTPEDYHDDDEWIAICLSQKELNEQIEEQRKKIESYDEFLKRAYASPVKLLAYEYIPKQGFRRVNLEAVSDNNCES